MPTDSHPITTLNPIQGLCTSSAPSPSPCHAQSKVMDTPISVRPWERVCEGLEAAEHFNIPIGERSAHLVHAGRQAQERTLERNFRSGQPRSVIRNGSPPTGGTTTDLFALVVRVEYPKVGLRVCPSSRAPLPASVVRSQVRIDEHPREVLSVRNFREYS
jgi:hypothetical protein